MSKEIFTLIPDQPNKPAIGIESVNDYFNVVVTAVDGSIIQSIAYQTLGSALRGASVRIDEVENKWPGTKWEIER